LAVIRFIDFVLDLVSMDGQFTFTLGSQDSAKWSEGADLDAYPSVSYSYGEKQDTVELVCSSDGINLFGALGENPINTYRFILRHKCACWNGCEGK
jgi:hypothetical protein